MTNELPEKASDGLRLAISDLIKCENDPRYTINMSTWMYGDEKDCLVCLAGSVMSQTLNAPKLGGELTPYALDKLNDTDNDRKLSALNRFRLGDIGYGLDYWYGVYNFRDRILAGIPEKIFIMHYDLNPELFKQQVLDLADMLEKAGF